MADLQSTSWLPIWLLKFVAGAFLLGSIAWANHTTSEIDNAKTIAALASSEAVSLRAYAQETQRSLDRLEGQLNRVESKLDTQIMKGK